MLWRVANVPPLVKQKNEVMCWAAATEAWLAANPARRNYDQARILEGMQEEKAARPDGALLKGYGQGLWELYFGLRPIRESCSTFSIDKALKRLKLEQVALMLGLARETEMGHVVVAFAGETDPPPGDEGFLVVMDPLRADTYRKWKLSDIRAQTGDLTTWMVKLPLIN